MLIFPTNNWDVRCATVNELIYFFKIIFKLFIFKLIREAWEKTWELIKNDRQAGPFGWTD